MAHFEQKKSKKKIDTGFGRPIWSVEDYKEAKEEKYEGEKERQNIIDSYEAKRKKDSEYNGWTNYLTWSVALNIDNDRYMQEETQRAIGEGEIKNGYELKDWFKQSLEDSGNYNEEYNSYKLSDSWSDRELEDVNWNELYASYKRNYEEEEKYKKEKEKE